MDPKVLRHHRIQKDSKVQSLSTSPRTASHGGVHTPSPGLSCGFAPIMQTFAVLEVSAYYAGRWLVRPVDLGGAFATCQVSRRRSWKRGRPGSCPVVEVPSPVTRSWALCSSWRVWVTEARIGESLWIGLIGNYCSCGSCGCPSPEISGYIRYKTRSFDLM